MAGIGARKFEIKKALPVGKAYSVSEEKLTVNFCGKMQAQYRPMQRHHS
jgi:hypothetical protein